jgi:hypothetical protein
MGNNCMHKCHDNDDQKTKKKGETTKDQCCHEDLHQRSAMHQPMPNAPKTTMNIAINISIVLTSVDCVLWRVTARLSMRRARRIRGTLKGLRECAGVAVL